MMFNIFRAFDFLEEAIYGPALPSPQWAAANRAMQEQQIAVFANRSPLNVGLGLSAQQWRAVAEEWKAEADRSKEVIEAAKRAVESLRSREGENVDEWAEKLGAIFGKYTD